jgi:hypothetical protein
MPKYKVIVSRHVAENLLMHTAFISNVSPNAAESFVLEFEDILNRLEDNPIQYQKDTSFDNPDGYRRVLFAKWYKCLFLIEGDTVYVDSVVDCRQNPDKL